MRDTGYLEKILLWNVDTCQQLREVQQSGILTWKKSAVQLANGQGFPRNLLSRKIQVACPPHGIGFGGLPQHHVYNADSQGTLSTRISYCLFQPSPVRSRYAIGGSVRDDSE